MLKQVCNWLLIQSRPFKTFVVLGNDAVLLMAALGFSFFLRVGDFSTEVGFEQFLLLLAAPLIGLLCFYVTGIYRSVNRQVGTRGLKRIIIGATAMIFIWAFSIQISSIDLIASSGIPRSIYFLFWLISIILIYYSRVIANHIFQSAMHHTQQPSLTFIEGKKGLIYGFSNNSLLFAKEIERTKQYKILGIIDSDKSLHRQKADTFKIYPPQSINQLLENKEITDIFVDESHHSKLNDQKLMQSVQNRSIKIMRIPSIRQISGGFININELKPFHIEDLLGREAVKPDIDLMQQFVTGKVVLVTGAGGSIGGELCHQLTDLAAKAIIMLEQSEAALYQIKCKLEDDRQSEQGKNMPDIIAVLGSVRDESFLERLFKTHKIDIVFHAAAYKHVPLVEENPVEGFYNNTFGTELLTRIAGKQNVERFILISTDKAVRPTNFMGMSKRLAEMIVQAQANHSENSTIYSAVRFGNVLDSSGSVVPLFKKQIAKGGPVTVTDRNITRYFMLINEEVELVITSSAMAKNGNIYVLEMGTPMKIDDLARTMITLAGKSIKSPEMPDGDIEIVYTKLRPGEKMHEELHLTDNVTPSSHPRIMQAEEPYLEYEELQIELAWLENDLRTQDLKSLKVKLMEMNMLSLPTSESPNT